MRSSSIFSHQWQNTHNKGYDFLQTPATSIIKSFLALTSKYYQKTNLSIKLCLLIMVSSTSNILFSIWQVKHSSSRQLSLSPPPPPPYPPTRSKPFMTTTSLLFFPKLHLRPYQITHLGYTRHPYHLDTNFIVFN